MMFRDLNVIGEIKLVHPKDVQDGLVPLSENDITANLPYDPRVQRAFDHHASELIRLDNAPSNYVNVPDAPSAARVVFDYYGGKDAFPNVSDEMLAAVDKADSAQFTMEDVLNPQGWELLAFIMDARTGLGRFRNFNISNYNLMIDLVELCRDHSVAEVLQHPDVRERVDLYLEHKELFQSQLRRCATVHKNLVVLDLRGEETIYVGNRFMIYALYPETNISMHVIWGLRKQKTVFAVGKSIFDRGAKTNVGSLMLDFGGGGHEAAGTCQVDNAQADMVMDEIIQRITEDG
jgi:nanoRNase/pAp phosphatase (c-di-AMP/oligoRNAs hydrolase)